MDIKRVITALSAGIGTRQKKLAVVFFRGETPSATENTIFIPLSVCEDRNLLNKGIAYCIHEVGHTVFSSYEDWYIKRLNEDKKLRHLENILEDAVVEAGMIQNHPGAVLFLEPLMEEFLPGVWQKAKIADLRSATFTHCMMHSRSQVYPRLQVAAELRSKSREAVERFGSVELADQLEAVMDGPGSSLERGEQILELLAEQASSEQSPGPQAQEDESESSPQDPETGDEGGESDEPPEDGSAQEPASSESSDDDGDGQAPSEQSPEPQAQEDE
ncbi:hypothetical protein HAQ00_09360, partial [Acidithiobacillus caldus ATCC 51756]|uniref:hypothetical protein n=2 Tax=Acidithiobacillus caldus TaxID=33059 RepID=UPI001C071C6E